MRTSGIVSLVMPWGWDTDVVFDSTYILLRYIFGFRVEDIGHTTFYMEWRAGKMCWSVKPSMWSVTPALDNQLTNVN